MNERNKEIKNERKKEERKKQNIKNKKNRTFSPYKIASKMRTENIFHRCALAHDQRYAQQTYRV
jgi:hypothetical protein